MKVFPPRSSRGVLCALIVSSQLLTLAQAAEPDNSGDDKQDKLSGNVSGSDTQTSTADGRPDKELGVVVVTEHGSKGLRPETVEAGTFRGSDIMTVPSTVNVITREALDLQADQGLYEAVRNTAGVTRQQNGGETWDQLVIRGIGVENRTNYRLNGSLSVMNLAQTMMEDKDRVEVLKGASALYYGFTSPAGIVNFVTKRPADKPITNVSTNFDQYGTSVVSTDVSRRFGENDQYGLRVNAGGGAQGSYMDGARNGDRRFAAMAFDWKASSRLKITTDLEYDYRKVTEQAEVSLPTAVNGVITLPHPVDATKMVGPTMSQFQTEEINGLVRADYALNDKWVATLETGQAQTTRDRNLAIFKFNSAADVATGKGKITGNIQHTVNKSDLVKGELYGAVEAFGMPHELTLGVSSTEQSQSPIYKSTYSIASQNLYDPVPITTITYSGASSTPSTAELNSTDTGIYGIDRITLNSQWQLIAGLRNSTYQSDQGDDHYDVSRTTPMFAAIYQPVENLSFYTSFSRGVEEGDTAPSGTENEGQHMAPGVSRQYEVGTRWRSQGGTLVSAALFDINRPGAYTNSDNVYVSDGEQRYRGLELSTQGQLTEHLGWLTSAQWLDPRFQNTTSEYNGKLPENAARRTASAFLNYDVPMLQGFSVNGGAYYTGRRPVNDLDEAWLPSVTIYAAGARYITHLDGRKWTWQLNVENLTDKKYWAAAGTRLAAGAPRTIRLGIKVEL